MERQTLAAQDVEISVPKMTARDVNVFYGQKRAVNTVSIDVEMDNVTALIGPSGCGKSTFPVHASTG